MDQDDPMLGRCKLCLEKDVELQRSHILPAALYRLLRSSDTENPNPLYVARGVEVQTSHQERAYLLCRSCEQRISSQGETWVFRNGWKVDSTFPLASVLEKSPRSSDPHGNTSVYQAARIPEISISALAYFGASIFWRSSIHNQGLEQEVNLGPYNEPFRRYLAGESDFPEYVSLVVCVRVRSATSELCQLPSRLRYPRTRAHTFTMPGLSFNLFISKNLPEELSRACIVRGIGNPIVVSDLLEDRLMKGIKVALDEVPKSKRLTT